MSRKSKDPPRNLTPKLVKEAEPGPREYRVYDSVVPGLFLRVMPSGRKSFIVVWDHGRKLSLGKYPGLTVEAARTRARAALVETAELGAPKDAGHLPAKALTFGDFMKEHYAPWALQHQKAGKATVDNIKAQFDSLYDKSLPEITAHEIERFKVRRLQSGIKPDTVNRDLGRIRSALSRAVEWGMLEAHPLARVKKVKGDESARKRYLSPDEEKRLRDALAAREQRRREARASGNEWREQRGEEVMAPWPEDGFTDHLMPMVLIAKNTGLRRGELFGLLWANVNLAGKQLTVVAGNAKSRKMRHVRLNTVAVDVLTRWRKQSTGDGLVFPGVGGGRFDNIKKSWNALAKEAQLVNFHFHDLRHDFASKLVMAGVDLNTVRELLGHADVKMAQRYAHLAPDHLAAAVEKLGPTGDQSANAPPT